MKKFLPYIIILVTLVGIGLFSLAGKVSAQTTGTCSISIIPTQNACITAGGQWTATTDFTATSPTAPTAGSKVELLGTCTIDTTTSGDYGTTGGPQSPIRTTLAACQAMPYYQPGNWVQESLSASQAAIAAASNEKTDFEKAVSDASCFTLSVNLGCVTKILYYILYLPSTFLLYVSAEFFNALIAISLNSGLLSNGFVSDAWAVVRDLSNIFFILILLYVAVKIILGIGSHDAKKTIVSVIILALLINFSMFFTKVVIDTSNILAQVFYSKLSVTGKDGKEIPGPSATGPGEKNVSGAMYYSFDATRLLNNDFFAKATAATTPGYKQTDKTGTKVAPGILLGIMLVAVAIMFFAAYCFFVSGIFFLSRLIELFILIVFSPFAFMSFTISELSGLDYIGWGQWSKRLLLVSFMAPIFMFFLYFIFLLLKANMFQSLLGNNKEMIQLILGITVPALVILILLLQATKFAKKMSGTVGEMLMKGAKIAGGFALGAATGGVAMLGSNTMGRIGRNWANNDELKAKAAAGDKGAQRQLALANSFAKSSYDFRQTGVGKFAAKQSGLDVESGLGVVGLKTEQLKGGRKERDKEAAKKFDDTRKTYMMSEAAAQKLDAVADPRNKRAEQYEKDLAEAKKNWENDEGHKKSGAEFREDHFKQDYVNGKNLKDYGLNKKVEEGPVDKMDDSKKINSDRQKAYALSLENPARKIEDGKAIKKNWKESFASSFGSGMKDPRLIAAATAAGIATAGMGGIGAALLPVGSLVYAIKDLVKAQAQQHNVFWSGEHPEIVAQVRKGVKTDKEEAWHHMQEAYGGGDHNKEKGDHPKPAGGHETPPPAAAPSASPTPHTPAHP